METFIYTSKNVLSPELCNKWIDTFNKSEVKTPGVTSSGEDDGKKSTDITLNPSFKNHPEWKPLLDQTIPLVKKHQKIYQDKYMNFLAFDSIRNETINYRIFREDGLKIYPHFNIQHYKPGEGFYDYHCERSTHQNQNRVLAWMFYLNDVTEGGGTQFYHQNHIEKAEQGKMVIFSSEWFHAHRGVSSKTQDKYILTGWIVLNSNKF
jgi:prolyl 4-hydroxylase